MTPKPIIIVSGLPRSGTSLMMNMLQAGGVKIMTDGQRRADQDNPLGYFELEKVKQLPQKTAWLKIARGRAVKIISKLLEYLPTDNSYQVIFMHREMKEILASQKKMLQRRKTKDQTPDKLLKDYFTKHLKEVLNWLKSQKNIRLLEIDYNQIVKKPRPEIEKVNQFLGGHLKTEEMMKVIDPRLYRHRD